MEDCSATKDMLEHCLEIYEKHLGEDHWKVARTLNDLSNAFGKLGDHNKKKNLLERAFATHQQQFGEAHLEAHIEVATTLANLGNACGDLGDPNKQKTLLERALMNSGRRT